MSNKDVNYYVENFYSKSNPEEFFFLTAKELDDLYSSYIAEMSRACCSGKRRVKNSYKKIITKKFNEYQDS